MLRERPVDVSDTQLAAACRALTGEIDQVPPMHSALKHEGKALYEYARQGVEIERAARRVTIHAIDIVSRHDALVVLDVTCSKGTYIRTLAQDLGESLGCGAHLAALRRKLRPDAIVFLSRGWKKAWPCAAWRPRPASLCWTEPIPTPSPR